MLPLCRYYRRRRTVVAVAAAATAVALPLSDYISQNYLIAVVASGPDAR